MTDDEHRRGETIKPLTLTELRLLTPAQVEEAPRHRIEELENDLRIANEASALLLARAAEAERAANAEAKIASLKCEVRNLKLAHVRLADAMAAAMEVIKDDDAVRLLGPARMVRYRCAERVPGSAEEAAAMAQRIVDLIGHSVTDEPPRAVVERDELRQRVEDLENQLAAAADVIADTEGPSQ